MALVFTAVADESDGPKQRGPFFFGGFVASADAWTDIFAPAWEERVLNGPPAIPYMHVADIKSPKWQKAHGLTWHQADQRLDEACCVIASTGALHPVTHMMDGGHFRDVFGQTRVVRQHPQPALYQFDPDYIGFLGFAIGALEVVHNQYPNADKVDFLVEKKTRVTRNLGDFVGDGFRTALHESGYGHLASLVGVLVPGSKERVPLQAADVALWHHQRFVQRKACADDVRRLQRMFNDRWLTFSGLTVDQITAVGERSKHIDVVSPFPPKRQRQG